jgi:hypothetical protein
MCWRSELNLAEAVPVLGKDAESHEQLKRQSGNCLSGFSMADSPSQ